MIDHCDLGLGGKFNRSHVTLTCAPSRVRYDGDLIGERSCEPLRPAIAFAAAEEPYQRTHNWVDRLAMALQSAIETVDLRGGFPSLS